MNKITDSKYTYLAFGIVAGLVVAYAKNIMLKKPTQSEIKQAYDLVTADLFHNLKKAQDGDKIKLGNLGSFHKKRATIQSALDGNTYRYYRISFKVSAKLKDQNQLNNQSTNPEPSGLMKMVGQSLPFLPLLFEQFTGQKVPQISGTMAEIQMALNQVITSQQAIMQRLTTLENNASRQLVDIAQQVQSIKSVRLTHQKETKAIDYNLNQNNQEIN
ncbi:9142_t:CDS:2 [Entrophospora sp. SA101]|nr:9142_t:CDS:2 [Entrophospora sp. SA101]